MSDMVKLAAVGIGVATAGLIAILVFNELWFRIGLGAAIAVIVGVLLFIAWRVDRKAEREREEFEQA